MLFRNFYAQKPAIQTYPYCLNLQIPRDEKIDLRNHLFDNFSLLNAGVMPKGNYERKAKIKVSLVMGSQRLAIEEHCPL